MRESGLGHQFRAWGKVAGRLVGGNETPASVVCGNWAPDDFGAAIPAAPLDIHATVLAGLLRARGPSAPA